MNALTDQLQKLCNENGTGKVLLYISRLVDIQTDGFTDAEQDSAGRSVANRLRLLSKDMDKLEAATTPKQKQD